MDIVMGIQVCLISWMNFDYNENGGKKSFFFANLKHQYRASQRGEHDCGAKNKKNRDNYEYPSLAHFSIEL